MRFRMGHIIIFVGLYASPSRFPRSFSGAFEPMCMIIKTINQPKVSNGDAHIVLSFQFDEFCMSYCPLNISLHIQFFVFNE